VSELLEGTNTLKGGGGGEKKEKDDNKTRGEGKDISRSWLGRNCVRHERRARTGAPLMVEGRKGHRRQGHGRSVYSGGKSCLVFCRGKQVKKLVRPGGLCERCARGGRRKVSGGTGEELGSVRHHVQLRQNTTGQRRSKTNWSRNTKARTRKSLSRDTNAEVVKGSGKIGVGGRETTAPRSPTKGAITVGQKPPAANGFVCTRGGYRN